MASQDGNPGLIWAPLRRHWRWVLGLTAALGLLVTALLNGTSAHRYSATALYLVTSSAPSGATDPALVSANTDRSARDYAVILRSDDRLLTALATVAGRTKEQVREGLSVDYVPAGSTIAVTYRASRATEVRAVIAELDRLVADSSLGSSGFAPGAVRPLHTDLRLSIRTLIAGVHPAVGVGAGLMLGMVVALLLARTRPRVTNRLQLQVHTEHPVLEIGDDASRRALARRALSSDRPVLQVVAVSSRQDATAEADRLRAVVAELAEPPVVVADRLPRPASEAAIIVLTDRGESLRRLDRVLEAWDEYDELLVALDSAVPA